MGGIAAPRWLSIYLYKMNIVKNITRVLVAAFFLTVATANSQADATHQKFVPVKTMKEAEAIKPGDRIAISCGNCGTMTVLTADKKRSYLKEYVCEKCKKKFETVTNPIGGSVGYFHYEDEGGHKARLYRVE